MTSTPTAVVSTGRLFDQSRSIVRNVCGVLSVLEVKAMPVQWRLPTWVGVSKADISEAKQRNNLPTTHTVRLFSSYKPYLQYKISRYSLKAHGHLDFPKQVL
jgi:hypothetical protein